MAFQVEKKRNQPTKRVVTTESNREMENETTSMSYLEQEVLAGDVQDEGPPCPPAKKQCLEQNEEANPMTPLLDSLRQELKNKNEKIKSLKKKLKSSQQQSRRLKAKVTSMKEIVKSLKQQDLISNNCEEMLNQTFSGVPLALMKRMTAKKTGKGWRYSPMLKSFALTLQFYSTKGIL